MTTPEKIGAFFDLDGTLLAPPSLEWRFIGYLIERNEIRAENVKEWVRGLGKDLLNGWQRGVLANKHYLAGIHESFVEEWANTITPRSTSESLRWFEEGIDHVRRHLEEGHRVVLVTGTLEPLARVVASHLPGGVEIRATKLEIRDECFTGRILGQHLGFEEKARVMRECSRELNVDLSESFAYGNEMSDAKMLEAVGHPTAVNASWRLKREARRRGWLISTWRDWHGHKRRAPQSSLAARGVR